MNWRPIKSAPRDGTEFQAWLRRSDFFEWWEPRCRFNPEYGAFEVWQRVDYDDDGFDTVDAIPIHWMPPPSSPTAGEKS